MMVKNTNVRMGKGQIGRAREMDREKERDREKRDSSFFSCIGYAALFAFTCSVHRKVGCFFLGLVIERF